jgi:uncharacterized protein YbjT (DUF2867 family)
MKIAIVGANGYIGRNLLNKLLEDSSNEIVAISQSAQSIPRTDKRLTKINQSVFDPSLKESIRDCDVVYYLVHMMSQNKMDYAEAEKKAAEALNLSLVDSKVKRVVYLGGLGDDKDNLSKHLKSRHTTGDILRTGKINVIELRASMVIGRGGISYEIIVNLVSKLPFLTVPRWSETYTQPIGLDDALKYLVASKSLDTSKNLIIEIGGPEVLSYLELMKRYAKWKGMKRVFIRIPIIPIAVSAWWLNLFTPKNQAKVGRIMVESMANEMVVSNDYAKQIFPDINPKPLDQIFQ